MKLPDELFPDDAPEPGACVRVERPEDGLAVVRIDPPHRGFAVLDAPTLRDLDLALDEVAADGSLQGVVLTGAEPDRFAGGADVAAIEAVRSPQLVEDMVRTVHALFARVSDLAPRTVAAVGGPVPGGAYELSLACDLIVATDSDATRIGLPETQLGLFPAWGGAHRLPRRVGVPLALDAILSGRLLRADAARRRGMVDRLCKPEHLLRVAADLALGREAPRTRSRGWKLWLVDKNPLALAIIGRAARKQVMARTHGRYPAPLVALDMVLAAPRTPLHRAAEKESRAVAPLVTGPICKSLTSIFFGSEAAKKLGQLPDGSRPEPVARAHVIGAGVMGGGIASLFAEKGIRTRLSDLSQQAADASLADHRAHVRKLKRKRRLEPWQVDPLNDHLDAGTEPHGLGQTDLVIEAVAERMDVKHAVLGAAAARAPADALICTNTSSLSVAEIAAPLPHPERVVGLHFFNPVRKMPLVEIVRGPATSDVSVARAAALTVRLGKTPVVVADVAGFLVNRLLGPYLDEAVRLFVGGADCARLDRALLDFGMPMGPLRLIDEVGLDIGMHVAASLHGAYGERMTPTDGIAALAGDERLGAKTGKGFYDHPRGKGRPTPCDDLARWQTGEFARGLPADELVDRCVLAMLNEAARCLEEGVVSDAAALDLATVFGMGFPPFHGGLLRWADTLGAGEIVRRLEQLGARPEIRERPGGAARFEPAPLLRELAGSGGSFRDPNPDRRPVAADAR